jgi:hypothetical protein
VHQDYIKGVISNEIIKKDLEDVKHEFDNLAIYTYLDNKYLRILQKDSLNFLDYVKNPIDKFKKEVERRAGIHFTGIIESKREKASE